MLFDKGYLTVARSAKSKEPKQKRQKHERKLENLYAPIRISAVAGALEHRRTSGPAKQKRRTH
jgi:hypothetical protein